jgi:hypothetical protein
MDSSNVIVLLDDKLSKIILQTHRKYVKNLVFVSTLGILRLNVTMVTNRQ